MAERLVQPDIFELHPSHKLRYKFAKQYIKPHHIVLDYGCGIGYGTWMLAPYCAEISGRDKSEEAISYGRKYYRRENMLLTVADKPEGAGVFDIITAFEVIEHVEDSLKLLKELGECLKEDGRLIISVPNELAVHFTKEDPRCEFHYRHFTPDELDKLVKDAGLMVESRLQQRSKVFPAIVGNWATGYTLIGVLKKP